VTGGWNGRPRPEGRRHRHGDGFRQKRHRRAVAQLGLTTNAFDVVPRSSQRDGGDRNVEPRGQPVRDQTVYAVLLASPSGCDLPSRSVPAPDRVSGLTIGVPSVFLASAPTHSVGALVRSPGPSLRHSSGVVGRRQTFTAYALARDETSLTLTEALHHGRHRAVSTVGLWVWYILSGPSNRAPGLVVGVAAVFAGALNIPASTRSSTSSCRRGGHHRGGVDLRARRTSLSR